MLECSATVECAPRTSSSGRDEQTEHERVRKPSPWSHAATVDAKSLGRTIAEEFNRKRTLSHSTQVRHRYATVPKEAQSRGCLHEEF